MSTAQVEVHCRFFKEYEPLASQLASHMRGLEMDEYVKLWEPVSAGKETKKELGSRLERAGIILILPTKDFLNDDEAQSDFKRVLEKHERGEARAVVVKLKPSYIPKCSLN